MTTAYRRAGQVAASDALNTLITGVGSVALARNASLTQVVNTAIRSAVIDLGTSTTGAESGTNRGNQFQIDPEFPFSRLKFGVNTTVTFNRSYLLPQASELYLLTTQTTGGHTLTLPSSVKWAGGTAPTITTTASTSTLYRFTTFDFGTTWTAFLVGTNFSGI